MVNFDMDNPDNECTGFVYPSMQNRPNVKFPRLITNIEIKNRKKYETAIRMYEQKHPEYAGMLIISDKPEHIIDIHGRTLRDWKQHRAFMQTKIGPATLTDFWKIYEAL